MRLQEQTVRAREVFSGATFTVRVVYDWRTRLALGLIRLAAWLVGAGVEIKEEETDDLV